MTRGREKKGGGFPPPRPRSLAARIARAGKNYTKFDVIEAVDECTRNFGGTLNSEILARLRTDPGGRVSKALADLQPGASSATVIFNTAQAAGLAANRDEVVRYCDARASFYETQARAAAELATSLAGEIDLFHVQSLNRLARDLTAQAEAWRKKPSTMQISRKEAAKILTLRALRSRLFGNRPRVQRRPLILLLEAALGVSITDAEAESALRTPRLRGGYSKPDLASRISTKKKP